MNLPWIWLRNLASHSESFRFKDFALPLAAIFCFWSPLHSFYIIIFTGFFEEKAKRLIAAIICGLIAGFVGFLPLIFGLKLVKNNPSTSNFSPMAILLICLVVSFALLFASVMVVNALAHSYTIPFTLCLAVSLSVTAIVYGIKRQKASS